MISTNLSVIAIRQRRSGKQWIFGRGRAKGRLRGVVYGGGDGIAALFAFGKKARNDHLVQTT